MPSTAPDAFAASMAEATASYTALATSVLAMTADVVSAFMTGVLQPVADENDRRSNVSWYRQPAADPFSMKGFFSGSADPFGLNSHAAQFWMAAATRPSWPVWHTPLASPFQPTPAWSLAFPAFWGTSPTPFSGPATLSNYPVAVFSAYRSDSGHAVAQIILDTMATAARAQADLARRTWH